jgi:hypothetical protein
MNSTKMHSLIRLELTSDEWIELLTWAGENCIEPNNSVSLIVKEFLRDLRDTARMLEEMEASS